MPEIHHKWLWPKFRACGSAKSKPALKRNIFCPSNLDCRQTTPNTYFMLQQRSVCLQVQCTSGRCFMVADVSCMHAGGRISVDPFSPVSSNCISIKSIFTDKFISTFDSSQPCTFYFLSLCQMFPTEVSRGVSRNLGNPPVYASRYTCHPRNLICSAFSLQLEESCNLYTHVGRKQQ